MSYYWSITYVYEMTEQLKTLYSKPLQNQMTDFFYLLYVSWDWMGTTLS